MKRFYLKLRIFLLTLTLGLLSIWIYGVYKEIVRSLNNKEAITNPDKGKPRTFVLPFEFNGELMKVDIDENERLTMIGHACGNGYADGYISSEGERLSSGLDIVEPANFKKETARAEIIEKIDDIKDLNGNNGIRLVLKEKNKESGKDYFEIVGMTKRKISII